MACRKTETVETTIYRFQARLLFYPIQNLDISGDTSTKCRTFDVDVIEGFVYPLEDVDMSAFACCMRYGIHGVFVISGGRLLQ